MLLSDRPRCLRRACRARIARSRRERVCRAARIVAVFGVVVGALHVLHAGRNGNRAAKMRAGAGETFEIGERVEGEIDFAGRAAEFVAADAFEEISGKLAGFKKFFESEMRVNAGGDDVGGEFLAALQSDTGGAAVLHENFSDRRLRSNLDASFARSIRNRIRNGSRAAAAEAPGAERAIDFAHVMVQENVSRAGRTNAEKRADD